MTERKELQTQVEMVDKWRWKRKVAWAALLGTLLFGKVVDWVAQEVKTQERKENQNWITLQAPTQVQSDTLTTWDEATSWPNREPDPLEWEESEWWESWDQWWKEKTKTLEVHGTVRWGSDVTPLLWSVLSDNPALMLTIDASNPQTWLWVSIIRADDFDTSMDNPAGQATLVDLYWQKKFWNLSVMWVWEYAHIDKLPGADSFTPIVWCTYEAWKWWTIDAWAWHTIQEWDDIDVVRLWVTKQLNESLSLAAQGFYRSDLSKKFYGRVQANVILWKGFWAQLSFIAQEWKITPTAWILYKF